MEELHFSKKDFRIEWYSGSGAGGQHRNAHQNCCRIIHLETGLKAVGTESRSRVANQKTAFSNLAKRILAFYHEKEAPKINKEVIRTYNAHRNVVKDSVSGFKQPYKEVVINADLDDMIEARALKISL